MPAKCWSSIRSRVARITKLDACGRPVAGQCNQVVTDGYISIEYEAEISEGEDVEVKKANGQICVSDVGCPELRWFNVTIEFCQVDPDLFTMMSGYTTELDFAGNAVGNRIGKSVLCTGGFALETWSDIPGPCDTTGAQQFGYFLLPFVKNFILSSFTLENDAASFTFEGRTEYSNGWGVGPYNVVPTDAAVPPTAGPLVVPIAATDAMLMQLTTVPPPVAVCGCQPQLVVPPLVP